VLALSVIFFVLACGNTFTALSVIARKIRAQRDYLTLFQFQTKYRSSPSASTKND